MMSIDVVIESAKYNGVDLDKFKATYNSNELVELLEALLAGIPEKVFLDKHHTVSEIRDKLRDHYSVKPDVIIEEYIIDEVEDLPCIADLPSLGVEPSYIDLNTVKIPYKIHDTIAYVESSGTELLYQVMEIQEGTLLYKINYPSFLIKKADSK